MIPASPSLGAASNRRGALFMVLAMACFALEDASLKAATAHVPPAIAIMGFGLLGMAGFALIALSRGERPLPRLTGGLMLRSGIELCGRLFYSLALAFTGLGLTSAILQATPLVVVAGAVVVFGEKVGWRRWLAIAVGLSGVMLVLRPTGDGMDMAAIFAVLGMLGFAGRDLATRAAPLTVTNAQLGVLGMTVLFVAGLVVQLAARTPLVLPGPLPAAQIALTALFGVAAYAALTVAMRTGEVSVVTPFRYTRLVFALILAALMFGEVPDAWMIAGCVLIVGSGLFTLARGRRMV
ncbi:EamA family transporter [Pararhodobacter marinus]|uniref:EamA family transporter n=1 Tax=Pararhodobacter marinus TaxID=2184063 RepID=A0A2U2C5T4_9RHOB|nr:DMT family transporter [Pararhodobacter marinus]PWE27255.1 EamA family transporter [Pararhodobacter marinus]